MVNCVYQRWHACKCVLIYLSNQDLSAPPCSKTQLAGSALLNLALLWPPDGLTVKQHFRCRQQQLAATNIQPKRLPCDLSCFRCKAFSVGTPGKMWSLLRPAGTCRSVLLCSQNTYASVSAFADRDGHAPSGNATHLDEQTQREVDTHIPTSTES